MPFKTDAGVTVPAVTADQMREVDRVAVEVFGLGILQMMENAGRNLAEYVMALDTSPVTVLAGAGGNGGGGLCCARHLHNRGYDVTVILDRDADALEGPAANQLHILLAVGIEPLPHAETAAAVDRAGVVVDALIGYSLRGAPRGRAAELIDRCNRSAATVLSLDIPSGMLATTGETPGVAVRPDHTLTLAAPKTGLEGLLFLADIGIPPAVFRHIGIDFPSPFSTSYRVRLT